LIAKKAYTVLKGGEEGLRGRSEYPYKVKTEEGKWMGGGDHKKKMTDGEERKNKIWKGSWKRGGGTRGTRLLEENVLSRGEGGTGGMEKKKRNPHCWSKGSVPLFRAGGGLG